MHEIRTPVVVASPDRVIDKLPPIFRIQSLTRLPADSRHTFNRAVLFHHQASLQVEWVSRHVDVELKAGSLVSVCWQGRPACVDGAVRIARLVCLRSAEDTLNLFDTVPSSWGIDRDLIERGARLWNLLSRPHQRSALPRARACAHLRRRSTAMVRAARAPKHGSHPARECRQTVQPQ